MLEDVHSLPGSQGEVAIIHGDGEAGIGQHGADVRGRIVGSFQVVGVPTVPFGNEAFHIGFQVGAGSWIPILVYDQGSAGMLQKQKAHPLLDIPLFQLRPNGRGDIVEPLAKSRNFKSDLMPIHCKDYSRRIRPDSIEKHQYFLAFLL